MTKIISALLVKELRERTSAGMMECKKALEVSEGDLEKAIEVLRKTGRAKADVKAGRVAAEGVIVCAGDDKHGVMLEINSETDFVSRDHNFTEFAKKVADAAQKNNVSSVDELGALPLEGTTHTIEEVRRELVAKVGENVQVRRLAYSSKEAVLVGTYVHGNRIGVMVELDTDNKDLARDIAMHIAASKPLVIGPENVPQALIDKEKEIYSAQAASSGKPAEIVEKMVAGRLKKYVDEISLTGQPFVKDPDVTVGSLLNKHRAKVIAFHRFEVGEGIDKVSEDFKDAVMSQVNQGS